MAVNQRSIVPLQDADHHRQLGRAVIASTPGTTIEGHDVAISLLRGYTNRAIAREYDGR
jgi:hypothetical protein